MPLSARREISELHKLSAFSLVPETNLRGFRVSDGLVDVFQIKIAFVRDEHSSYIIVVLARDDLAPDLSHDCNFGPVAKGDPLNK